MSANHSLFVFFVGDLSVRGLLFTLCRTLKFLLHHVRASFGRCRVMLGVKVGSKIASLRQAFMASDFEFCSEFPVFGFLRSVWFSWPFSLGALCSETYVR